MNRQELIKEYKDYGFTNEEIAKELNIPEVLVKSALMPDPKVSTDRKTKHTGDYAYKQFANDRDRPMYEALYKYGPKELNRMLKHWGFDYTAKYIGLKKGELYALKYHFGYHNPFPMNAAELIAYFPIDVRKQVDGRDGRICQRCNRPAEDHGGIRYHKIYHPGPNNINNCITLCRDCRSHRVLKHTDHNLKRFEGFTFETFKQWIDEHDPFHQRNRVYPKGQIGTWGTQT